MLALRRLPTICQYVYIRSAYQLRFKSTDDDSNARPPQLNDDLLNFERKISRHSLRSENAMSTEKEPERKQAFNRPKSASNDSSNQRKKPAEERNRPPASNAKLNLAKPTDFKEKNRRREGEQQTKSRPHVILDTESNDVKILTRQVADSLTPPNSTQQSSSIEQDLLDVLRGHRVVSKSARRLEKQSAPSEEKPSEQSRKSSDPLKKPAVQKRARPTSAAAEQTSEAFSSLLRDIKLKPAGASRASSLGEDSIPSKDEPRTRSRSDQSRDQTRDSYPSQKSSYDTKRRQEYLRPQQLGSGEPLGIFNSNDIKDLPFKISPIWEKYEQEELKRISAIPPRNAFEEMIQWTNDGILWKFPIDNEQDIGQEATVPFYEHVLLERHLSDFPDSPLIRQFMELVCVGLGRNPYWTVQQKLEHIHWFRSYFTEKMSVFNETVHTGAVKAGSAPVPVKPVSTFKPKPASAPVVPKVAPAVVVAAPAAVKTPTASKK